MTSILKTFKSGATSPPTSVETFILTLSESQKLYNIRNKKRKPNKHNIGRKSKYIKSLSLSPKKISKIQKVKSWSD